MGIISAKLRIIRVTGGGAGTIKEKCMTTALIIFGGIAVFATIILLIVSPKKG